MTARQFSHSNPNSLPSTSSSPNPVARTSPATSIPIPEITTLSPSSTLNLLHQRCANNNSTMSGPASAVNRDFYLYDTLDNSTPSDFQLFGPSKQERLATIHQLQQMNQRLESQQQRLEQNRFTIEVHQTMATHDRHTIASMARPSIAQGNGGSITPAALRTPQTPSLDLLSSNTTVRADATVGFDNLVALFDDPGLDFATASVVSTFQNDMMPFRGQYYQQNHAPLVDTLLTPALDAPFAAFDTPFSPYLDTPFETPALSDFDLELGGDFGYGSEDPTQLPLFGIGHSSGVMSDEGVSGLAYPHTLPLPPQMDFELPGGFRGSVCNTIEPSTLFASPIQPSPSAPIKSGAGEDSGPLFIKIEDADDDDSSLSFFSSVPSSPLLDADDMASKDDPSDLTDEDDMGDYEDDNLHHHQAASASGNVVSFVYSGKRRATEASAPAISFASKNTRSANVSDLSASGDHDSEDDMDDYSADSTYIPVATFVHNHNRKRRVATAPTPSASKKTRLAPASPYEEYHKLKTSSHSTSFKQTSGIQQTSTSLSTAQSAQLSSSPNAPLAGSAIQRGSLLSTPQKTVMPFASSTQNPSSEQVADSDIDSVRRFRCAFPGCPRAFARLFNLRTHVRTHDPNHDRPFVCEAPDCGKSFSRKHDLQRHETSVHLGERRFQCHYCSKYFSRHDGLRRHYNLKNSACGADLEVRGGMEALHAAEDKNEEEDSYGSETENGSSAT